MARRVFLIIRHLHVDRLRVAVCALSRARRTVGGGCIMRGRRYRAVAVTGQCLTVILQLLLQVANPRAKDFVRLHTHTITRYSIPTLTRY
jgi:hypothetical protein